MVGCDIDGVATVGFRPDEDFVFVSGRLTHEWARTIKELGTDHPIYLRPFGADCDRVEAANWKAKIVDWLKLTAFYEDDELQAGIIKGKCPDCDVVLVKEKNA